MQNNIRIPDSEFKERVVKIQKKMAETGYDMLLCYGNEAEPQFVRYFSDYWPSFETAGVIIPIKGEAKLLIGPESYTYAADRSRISDIRLVKSFRESSEPEYPGKPLDTFTSIFKDCLGDAPIKKFGVAGLPLLTVGIYNDLMEHLKPYGDVVIEKADDVVASIRMYKTENELACMRKAAEITRATMEYVINNIHVGMTETQVVGLALGKMHELGAERESYPLWVLTGDGSDQAISRPRNKVIKEGDLTFLQIGARYEGYASTIGRPVVFGKATPDQRALIEAGYEVQRSVLEITKAGVPASEVAKFHLNKVKELGFEDHYLYGPFHGNGLMEGEAPWVETSSDYLLAENMTFCSDIFLGSHKTKRGIRIEDVIRVTKDGCENLTNFPRKLFEIK